MADYRSIGNSREKVGEERGRGQKSDYFLCGTCMCLYLHVDVKEPICG